MVLYLFKAAVGAWLCVHGPENIDNYLKFNVAWDAGQLVPVWGSWGNFIANGHHYWDSWDCEARQWGAEDYLCESKLLL
jgi:hypothetical protein